MANEFVVLSDIHGNATALQAVVDAEGADSEFIVLGDIHGLLAQPAATQQLVQEVSNYTLAGNHDKALFEYGEGHVVSDKLSQFELYHTLSNLSKEQKDWMCSLNYLKVLTRNSKRICLCHAYPWPEKASGYEAGNAGISKGDVPHIASTVSDDYDYVFHGHNHSQFELDCAKFGHDVHFVNPGSLGYDQTYTTVNTDTGDVTHKNVDIPLDDVQSHVQEHLPEDAPHTNRWF